LVLAEALTEGVLNVNDLFDLGINCLKDLYRETNWLLGADHPPSLLPSDVRHRRGRTLVHQWTAQELIDVTRSLAREKTPPGFHGVDLAGVLHPVESLNHGIFVTGPTGSGKSSILDRLRKSIAPLIGGGMGYKTRVVDFDDKGATLGKWHSILPPEIPIHYFQPLALNSVRWDLSRDFVTVADAFQLATMMIPEGSGGSENQFFYNAARAGFFAFIVLLQRFGGKWGLWHLVSAPREQGVFYQILSLRPETRSFARYFKDSREGRAIHSTLRSCLDKYAVVAACQEHATESYTCAEFQDAEGVLVLGFDPAATAALSGLHQLIVQRLSETALRRQNMTDRTLFVFDKFRLWSKTPSETLVMTAFRGRASGAGLIIGAQDVNGIDFIYRREQSRELLANLLTKVFLGAGSIEGARFASECIGCHEVIQSTWNESWSQGGYSQSVNRSIVRRELVTLDEIMANRKADWHRDRIEGYCLTPFTPPFRFETSFRAVAEAVRPPIDFVPNPPRPAKHQRLKPFRLKDAEALNFPPRPALLKVLR
jgi:hypothetical protein